MTKILKYLKPFLLMILSAIILLFAQATCDLSLPDYMSNIVNVGIQQSGIKDCVPDAMSLGKMKQILMHTNKNDKDKIINDYILIDKKSNEYDKYVKKYPKLKEEPIYVLNKINKKQREEIENPMAKAFLASYKFGKMPKVNKKSIKMDNKMMNEAAIYAVKSEYKNLGVDILKMQKSYIYKTGFYMILISLLSVFCTVLVGFFASKVSAGVAKNLRRDVFVKIEQFSNIEFDKFSTSSLITRTTNDIVQIQMLIVMGLRIAIYAPIMGIGGIIRALNKSTSMSWIIALSVIILIGLVSCVFSLVIPRFKIIQKLVDKLNLVSRENLSGMMVTRAFNAEKFQEERFDNVNKELTKINLFVNRIMVAMSPTMMFIMNGISILIVWIGAKEVANSNMQVGDMMAFMQYAIQIIGAFVMMSVMFIMIPRASVSSQRIVEILETNVEIKDSKNPSTLNKDGKGLIEFKNVSFKYKNADGYALDNINFTAYPGKVTAIIGSTGSGKTTLVNLIQRFYDVTHGQILIDGVDVKDIKQYDLRNIIGYVPQKANLFEGTIKSNLLYANENASVDDINEVLKISQAYDFVSKKPNGIDSEISEGGGNVSGGQKQRLCISRALIKKSKIYIFDDSFSALDLKTDLNLRLALKEKINLSTLIIVAQRISTIKNADNIIVLDKGKVVGYGTHDYLMKNCDTYKEIALSQFSKEEMK